MELFEWENVGVIGKGGSSTVYKSVLKPLGEHIAVKQIDIEGMTKEQIVGIKGEIETIKTLSHHNIVSYIGTQQTANKIFILLEFADRGSIRQQYQQTGPLNESQVSYCLRQILEGLHYLHSNGIAHRDIKCANCLISNSGVIKLADFGASKRFESDSIVSGLKGTPHWMAPEVIKGTQMTTGWIKSDVWSLGCTVVEMYTGLVPYAQYENPMTAMYKIASGEIPSLLRRNLPASERQSEHPSEALLSFVRLCCAMEPEDRPSVEQLMLHPFVTQQLSGGAGSFADLISHSEEVHIPEVNAQQEQEQQHSAMFSPQGEQDAAEVDWAAASLSPRALLLRSSVDTTATYNNHRAHAKQTSNGHQSAAEDHCDQHYADDDHWETETAEEPLSLALCGVDHLETEPVSRCQTQQTQSSSGRHVQSNQSNQISGGFSSSLQLQTPCVDNMLPEDVSFGDMPTPSMFGPTGSRPSHLTRSDSITSSLVDTSRTDSQDEAHSGVSQEQSVARQLPKSVSSFRVPSQQDSEPLQEQLHVPSSDSDVVPTFAQATEVYQTMMDKYGSAIASCASAAQSTSISEQPNYAQSLVLDGSGSDGCQPHPQHQSTGASVKPNRSPVRVSRLSDPQQPPQTKPMSDQHQQRPSASSNKFGFNGSAGSAASQHPASSSAGPLNPLKGGHPGGNGKRAKDDKASSDFVRPSAPLSSEKLRIHTTEEDLMHSSNLKAGDLRNSRPVEKHLSAGAIRKKAMAELEAALPEINKQQQQQQGHGNGAALLKIKPSSLLSQQQFSGDKHEKHSQPVKRSRQERLLLASDGSEQLNQRAHNAEQSVVYSSGSYAKKGHSSTRSRSAGVTLSCEGGGHKGRDPGRKRLPPLGGDSALFRNNNEDSDHDDTSLGSSGRMEVARYIQTAPAVSRSVNLPPIQESGTYVSQTPKLKQPRLNSIARLGMKPAAPLQLRASTSSTELLPSALSNSHLH